MLPVVVRGGGRVGMRRVSPPFLDDDARCAYLRLLLFFAPPLGSAPGVGLADLRALKWWRRVRHLVWGVPLSPPAGREPIDRTLAGLVASSRGLQVVCMHLGQASRIF